MKLRLLIALVGNVLPMQTLAASVITLMILTITAAYPDAGQAQCVGDCSGDGEVSVDELVNGVSIALGRTAVTACAAFDTNGDSGLTVDELLQGVNAALSGLALHPAGACLRPGQTQNLVACADGTPVKVFLCTNTSRCLQDPTALQLLTDGTTEGGTFSLTSCSVAHAPLVIEAKPAPGTAYRIIDFGLLAAGAAAIRTAAGHGADLDNLTLSPVSEAAVRLLDENGLQNFTGEGAAAVMDAVAQANATTSFAGLDPATGAIVATETARNDPAVEATITANKLPTPTPTPSPTPTPPTQSSLFAIQLLGLGPTRTDPAAGVRVIRQDPTTGAVLADLLTDANGLADFGDVGSDRTTISIVTTETRPSENPSIRKNIFTFVNFPINSFPPANPFRFNNGDESDRPTLATVDVTLTNLPAGTNRVSLATGSHRSGNPSNGSSADFPNVMVDQLQSDGNISFLATAEDSTGVIRGCGSSVDIDPVAINDLTLAVDTGTPPMPISFNASEPVVTNGAQILRKGVVLDLDSEGGPQSPVPFGTFNFCSIPNADGFLLSLATLETSSTASREISTISPTLPSLLDVTVPSLSIDSLTRSVDGRTISWTRSGNDLAKVDFSFTALDWESGAMENRWELVGDPASTSVTLPALPADLSDRVPPSNGVGIRTGLYGLDIVDGFEDFGQKLSAADGDFEVFQFAATELIRVERSRPVLTLTKEGTGSGTVFSSPAGIDCGATCAANFAPGSTVTLTAVPADGSTFAGWSGSCGTPGNQVSVTLDDNQSCTVTFNTQ